MDVFYLCDRVIQDYANYVRSFVRVRDRRIDEFVQKSLRDEVLWPQPLIQLNPRAEGATHFLEPRERGWPLVCGFVERISSSHCAIRTTLRQLGLSQSLFQEVFAWLPDSSQELVDRGAISPSSSLPARFRRLNGVELTKGTSGQSELRLNLKIASQESLFRLSFWLRRATVAPTVEKMTPALSAPGESTR